MACFCIIEEGQQAAQASDSREVGTSSMDRMAQTPTLCALIFVGYYFVDFSYSRIFCLNLQMLAIVPGISIDV